MPTGFFVKPRRKAMEAPPVDMTVTGGRERFTTEEYMNQSTVPTSTPILPGVNIQGLWSPFSVSSQGQLVKQSFRDGDGKIVHTLHAVIDPVQK